MHTDLRKAQSVTAYIQTAFKDQRIKVMPVDKEFCKTHLKRPAISTAYYTIVPETPLRRYPSPFRCVHIYMRPF